MKRKFVFIYLLFNIYIFCLSSVVEGNKYTTGWSFENELFSIALLYSNPDREEAFLRFRLKDNTDQYQFSYKLSEFSRNIPQLLIMEQNGHVPFEGINIKLNTRRKEEIVSLKFVEDLNYKTGTYSFTLRPVDSPDINPVINLNIYHPRCAEIIIEKRNIHFNISSGPGRYGIKEVIKLEVKANYSGWTIRAFSTPLFLRKYRNTGLKNKDTYIPGERIFIACNGSQAVPIEKEGVVIEKDCKNMNEIYLVDLFIHSNSMDKAGEYYGGDIIFRLE